MATVAAPPDLTALAAAMTGTLVVAGEDGYDAARAAWNLAVEQRPVAVAVPADAADVAAVVRFARGAGLRVAPQGTGHHAERLGPLDDAVLLRTTALTGVEVDPVLGRCRVGAGAIWDDVMGPAAAHGLAPLAGSSPDVGVVGYSLGGGIGWLSRRYGLQCNAVCAVELVTGDGELVRADARHEPELLWALRGGKSGFGVVTAMEFALHPVAEVYGGALVWGWEHARTVLGRWAEWTRTAPDSATTSARLLQLPPLPDIPEALRGRQVVMIDGAICGDLAEAEEVLRPLRALEPELDGWGPMPAAALVRVHGDPEHPVPGMVDHRMLDALPQAAVDAIVEHGGPGSGSPLLATEIRHLGGALGVAPADHGALGRLDAAYVVETIGVPMDPTIAAAIPAHCDRALGALGQWTSSKPYLNFVGRPTDTATAFDADTARRLDAVRAQVDPAGTFRD